MHLYKAIGLAVGTPEALGLADRLTAWHDAMVRHQRRGGYDCDGDCPHVDAESLWQEAIEVFGDRARELGFLYTQGHARRRDAASEHARPSAI